MHVWIIQMRRQRVCLGLLPNLVGSEELFLHANRKSSSRESLGPSLFELRPRFLLKVIIHFLVVIPKKECIESLKFNNFEFLLTLVEPKLVKHLTFHVLLIGCLHHVIQIKFTLFPRNFLFGFTTFILLNFAAQKLSTGNKCFDKLEVKAPSKHRQQYEEQGY